MHVWNGYNKTTFQNIRNFSDPWLNIAIKENDYKQSHKNVSNEFKNLFSFVENLPNKIDEINYNQEDFTISNIFSNLFEITNDNLNKSLFSFIKVNKIKWCIC